MGDLISRSALYKVLEREADKAYDEGRGGSVSDIIRLCICYMNAAPAVDAVEVVRCGECKRNPDKDNWCSAFTMLVRENDFCCWGVKDDD